MYQFNLFKVLFVTLISVNFGVEANSKNVNAKKKRPVAAKNVSDSKEKGVLVKK